MRNGPRMSAHVTQMGTCSWHDPTVKTLAPYAACTACNFTQIKSTTSHRSWPFSDTGRLVRLRRPLINVCDRFDMVGDLTHYLYTNNMLRYIEGYVQKVSPAKAPLVVGSLLDCEAPDEFITNLILSVRSLIPVEGLCAEVGPPCPRSIDSSLRAVIFQDVELDLALPI